MDIIKQLNWRYAVKKFTDEKLSGTQLNTVLESVRLSPSGAGLQPYKLVVVEDYETRVLLGEHSFANKEKVVNASQLLVFAVYQNLDEAYADAYVQLCAKERQVLVEALADYAAMLKTVLNNFSSEEEYLSWAKSQAYLALGNMLTTCAAIGVDACPMEGFVTEKYDEILNLNERNLTTAVIANLGFRDEDDIFIKMKKVRWPQEDFLVRI